MPQSDPQTQAPSIDLNADLGEGGRFDEELLRLITSANVCCAAHAGSIALTERTVALAVQYGVTVGAHLGYPDRKNFGRLPIAMTRSQLEYTVGHQLESFRTICQRSGANLRYIKPHGALYHACSVMGIEQEVLRAFAKTYGLALMHQPDAALLLKAVDDGVRTVSEGFADRRYLKNGRLVPRSKADALLISPNDVAQQAMNLASGPGGMPRVGSICLHGDHPSALDFAHVIVAQLRKKGIIVQSQLAGSV